MGPQDLAKVHLAKSCSPPTDHTGTVQSSLSLEFITICLSPVSHLVLNYLVTSLIINSLVIQETHKNKKRSRRLGQTLQHCDCLTNFTRKVALHALGGRAGTRREGRQEGRRLTRGQRNSTCSLLLCRVQPAAPNH